MAALLVGKAWWLTPARPAAARGPSPGAALLPGPIPPPHLISICELLLLWVLPLLAAPSRVTESASGGGLRSPQDSSLCSELPAPASPSASTLGTASWAGAEPDFTRTREQSRLVFDSRSRGIQSSVWAAGPEGSCRSPERPGAALGTSQPPAGGAAGPPASCLEAGQHGSLGSTRMTFSQKLHQILEASGEGVLGWEAGPDSSLRPSRAVSVEDPWLFRLCQACQGLALMWNEIK